MFKLHVICAVVLIACLSWTNALPVKDQEMKELEDLINRYAQLVQRNDGLHRGGGEKERSHLTPDPLYPASIKTKRSLNNSDRRTLLYNYYARGLAPMYDKRNFDEIDRHVKFSGKRNSLDYLDQGTVKRNFDEIDRWIGKGFNSRLSNDLSMEDYNKRNFDEIDRYGKFNKRFFREVEALGTAAASPNGAFNKQPQHGSNLADEMSVINEYSQ